MTARCETCRFCTEDGGQGEDCGTYSLCTRPGHRHRTEPGESCSGYELSPWAELQCLSGYYNGK